MSFVERKDPGLPWYNGPMKWLWVGLALAAVLATLRALTPDVYRHFDVLRERMISGLERLFREAGVQAQVRGLGSIVSFDIGDRPTGDYRTLVETARDPAALIRMEVLLKGYFIAAGLGLCLSAHGFEGAYSPLVAGAASFDALTDPALFLG